MISLGTLLVKAINESQKSTYTIKMGAVIFDKNKIISLGRNYSNKCIKRYNSKYIKYPFAIHAEIDAILKAKSNLKGKSILVVRTNKNLKLRMAKPCVHCMGYLNYVGIKKVFYSNNNEEIVMINLKNHIINC